MAGPSPSTILDQHDGLAIDRRRAVRLLAGVAWLTRLILLAM